MQLVFLRGSEESAAHHVFAELLLRCVATDCHFLMFLGSYVLLALRFRKIQLLGMTTGSKNTLPSTCILFRLGLQGQAS